MSQYALSHENTVQRLEDEAIIPADEANVDYQTYLVWLAQGNVSTPPSLPPPVDADVSREYERRLFAILGARDLAHAAFIRADNEAELRELGGIPDPSASDVARIAELHAQSLQVARLIERYNAMASPPPVDFAADLHWQLPV